MWTPSRHEEHPSARRHRADRAPLPRRGADCESRSTSIPLRSLEPDPAHPASPHQAGRCRSEPGPFPPWTNHRRQRRKVILSRERFPRLRDVGSGRRRFRPARASSWWEVGSGWRHTCTAYRRSSFAIASPRRQPSYTWAVDPLWGEGRARQSRRLPRTCRGRTSPTNRPAVAPYVEERRGASGRSNEGCRELLDVRVIDAPRGA